MNALEAEGLHTFYGKSHILRGVGIGVEEGRITALLGRNGAGKTTTLRSLMGLTPARQGKVTIFGQDTTRWPPFRIAALGVGYVPEGRRVFAGAARSGRRQARSEDQEHLSRLLKHDPEPDHVSKKSQPAPGLESVKQRVIRRHWTAPLRRANQLKT